MKTSMMSIAILVGVLAGNVPAGYVLGTTNPIGNPLAMSAGSTSGPMLMNIASGTPSQDIMSAWNVLLVITAESGATGTVTFVLPTTGTPSNPTNYIFGNNGLGISVANAGSELSGNDFFNPGAGAGASAALANLLQMEFLATQGASGLFGVYAVEGAATTQWTDGGLNTQFFANVPNGTGIVQIGEIRVVSFAVPEPTSAILLGLGVLAIAGCRYSRKREDCLVAYQRRIDENASHPGTDTVPAKIVQGLA